MRPNSIHSDGTSWSDDLRRVFINRWICIGDSLVRSLTLVCAWLVCISSRLSFQKTSTLGQSLYTDIRTLSPSTILAHISQIGWRLIMDPVISCQSLVGIKIFWGKLRKGSGCFLRYTLAEEIFCNPPHNNAQSCWTSVVKRRIYCPNPNSMTQGWVTNSMVLYVFCAKPLCHYHPDASLVGRFK